MALTKEEKFIRIQECALELVASGRDKLSVSRLARKTKVSRPWIYKNFGTSQDDLLAAAAKLVGEKFTEIGEAAKPSSLSGLMAYFQKGAEQTLADLDRYPWIPKIYFEFLGDRSALGEMVRTVERAYREKVAGQLCRLGISEEKAKAKALASVKLRMAVAHAWCTDPAFRKLGTKPAVRAMMSVFDDLAIKTRIADQ